MGVVVVCGVLPWFWGGVFSMPRLGSGNDALILELVCCHIPTQTWSYCALLLASIL